MCECASWDSPRSCFVLPRLQVEVEAGLVGLKLSSDHTNDATFVSDEIRLTTLSNRTNGGPVNIATFRNASSEVLLIPITPGTGLVRNRKTQSSFPMTAAKLRVAIAPVHLRSFVSHLHAHVLQETSRPTIQRPYPPIAGSRKDEDLVD